MNHGTTNLGAVSGLVRRVIETEAWRSRVHRGKTYEHKRFIDFIVAKPLAGCGWEPDKVEALIKDDPETLALWREATVGKQGSHRSNPTMNDRGNAYTVARLKRDRPDLFEQVKAKKLSANAAAIKAGHRRKPTRFDQIMRWLPQLTADERARLRELLGRQQEAAE